MAHDKLDARFGTDAAARDTYRDDAHLDDAAHASMPGAALEDDDLHGVVLHEERLVGGTEKVRTGVVRVRVKVVTEEVTVKVPLRKQVLEVIESDEDPNALSNPQGLRKAREVVLHEDRIAIETVPYERVRIARRKLRDEVTLSGEVAREVLSVDGVEGIDETDAQAQGLGPAL